MIICIEDIAILVLTRVFQIYLSFDLLIVLSSWTNRLIAAKDHSSVQINVGKVDKSGVLNGDVNTYALCGYIRSKGEADLAFSELCKKDNLL